MNKPNVYEYSDYRSFLKSFSSDKKKQFPRWSLGAWAKQLDLKGTASLSMVINGQRRPGPKIVANLHRFFKFNAQEKRYFDGLIKLEKYPPGSSERMLILESLKDILPDRNLNFISVHQFSAVSDWYNYAIRQLTQVRGFQSDVSWIKQHLKYSLTESEIKKSIQLLLNLHLLKQVDGKITKTEHDIEVEPEVASEAVKRYHISVMELAQKALFSEPLDKREMAALTFAIDSGKIPEAKKLVAEFKKKMARLAEGEKNSVYQLNIQLFPLSSNTDTSKRSES